MSDYTEKIINYIDYNLTEKDADKFRLNIDQNKELKDEFLFIKGMNEYMNGKLVSENIEADKDYHKIEKETREDVNVFLNSEKKDLEILDYLSFAFPERNRVMTKNLQAIEKETKTTGIEEVTKGWTNELHQEHKKEADLLKFINTSSNKKKTKNSSFQISKSKFKKRKYLGRRRLYLWTASAAVIIILLMLLNPISGNSPLNEKIFADYHTQAPELMSIQVRNSKQNIKHEFNNALALYNQEKYKEAYIIFHRLASEDKAFIQAYYYSGLCQFEAKKYTEAIQIFDKLISDFDEYNLESKWFIALAYIKMNKISEAIPFLNDLSKQKSIYQKDSEEILKQIKIEA